MAAPSVPTTFPPYLVAGVTWQFDLRLFDQASGDEFLPDDGGTVTLFLNGHHSLELAASANTTTDVWEWRVAATTTDDITPITKADQTYSYRLLGTLASKIYDLGSGSLFVFANPDGTAGDDRRTFAQKALPLLQAEYLARVGGTAGTGHNSYGLLGRNIEKWTLAEIRAEIAALEAIGEKEVRGRPRPFHVGFTGDYRR